MGIPKFRVEMCSRQSREFRGKVFPRGERRPDTRSHTKGVYILLSTPSPWRWRTLQGSNQTPHDNRRRRCSAMRKLVKAFRPSLVLHHPHNTDSPNIWRTAWGGVRSDLPCVRAWASGIRYRNYTGDEPRAHSPRYSQRRSVERHGQTSLCD